MNSEVVVIIVILLGLAYIPEWTIPAIAVATLILAIAQWPQLPRKASR